MQSVTLIGIGRVGRALAHSLPASKYRLDSLVVREKTRWLADNMPFSLAGRLAEVEQLDDISSDIVIICTRDAEIETAARTVGPLIRPGTCVFHTSGSISSAILSPLRLCGAFVGTVHPLVSIAGNRTDDAQFQNCYFCVEGDPIAVDRANELVDALGGTPFTIRSEDKAIYHAAAVMACGHLTALIDASLEMIGKCGLSPQLGKRILMPLIESTVRNVANLTTSEALTGPFARADLSTIQRHLDAIESLNDDQLKSIYLLLGERSLDIALKSGADDLRVEDIRKRIFIAQSTSR